MPKTNIVVNLSDCDGNAYAIIGRVRNALRRAGKVELVEEFATEAMSGDYDHVLQTCMQYVEVE